MVDEVRLKVLRAELLHWNMSIQGRANALQEERNFLEQSRNNAPLAARDSLDRYIAEREESFRETEVLLSVREKYRELVEDMIDDLLVVDAEYTITPDAPPADAGSV